MSTDILIISIARGLIEVAGFAMIAQVILYLVAFKTRERNPIYKIFRVITQPVVKATRWLAPRVIIDRHIPALAFFLLFWIWIALAFVKRYLCALHQVVCQ